LRGTLVSSPKIDTPVAMRKGMWAVKLCSNNIVKVVSVCIEVFLPEPVEDTRGNQLNHVYLEKWPLNGRNSNMAHY